MRCLELVFNGDEIFPRLHAARTALVVCILLRQEELLFQLLMSDLAYCSNRLQRVFCLEALRQYWTSSQGMPIRHDYKISMASVVRVVSLTIDISNELISNSITTHHLLQDGFVSLLR